MKFKQIATTILKNFLMLVCGAVLGVLLFLICLEPVLYWAMPKNAGLAVIALAPVIIIIYSILFAAGGGVLGLIVYNVILLLKKWRKKDK
jgi:hypothetical protein